MFCMFIKIIDKVYMAKMLLVQPVWLSCTLQSHASLKTVQDMHENDWLVFKPKVKTS